MRRLLLSVWLILLLAGSVPVLLPSARATTNVWLAVGGTGDGTARNRPKNYYPDFIKWGILGGDPKYDRDVVLHFLPGEYQVQPFNTETVGPSNWRITILGEGARPEDTVLKLVPNFPAGASDGGSAWVNVIDLGRNDEYIRRFVLENITIDGNWAGQTNFNHRGYLRGYKNSPVYASARTGRIRNVIIRNYGSHGLVPQRVNDLGEGVEVFPLCVFTREEGQEPEDGDPAPWVVENCEVTGFNGLYNGYSSTLMAVVTMDPAKEAAGPNPQRRLVWFRGNQVRGNRDGLGVIGMGTAGLKPNMSGRVTWSDNTILNGAGFNTDTGMIRWLDFTNSLLLDVSTIGYLGTPRAGQPSHQSYQISGNSVRLVGFVLGRNYQDFIWAPDASGRLAQRTDPKLALGRPLPNPASGLMIGGIANDIRLTDNWFTTRSREQFGRLGGLGARESEFRLVHRLPDKDAEQPDAPTIQRYPATAVDLAGNMLSSVPFDFERLQPVGGRKVTQLADGSTPLLDKRAAARDNGRFVPNGTVERVAMLFTNTTRRASRPAAADTQLVGAYEVVFGTPSPAVSGGKFSVPVRLAIQPTPGSGLTGTRPVAQRPLSLEVLPGSLHPQKLTAVTGADGVATFTYDVKSGVDGMDFFRAWMDYGKGKNETLDEFQDAWASSNFAHGTTVGLVVDVDVADARGGNPGRIRLLRTGHDDQPLKVQLAFGTGPNAAEAAKDFRLLASSNRVPGGRSDDAANVTSVFELARGQRELPIRVDALPATARNGKLVNVQVKSGEGYGVGYPGSGDVVIFAPGK